MANTISLLLLCSPILLIILLGCYMLSGKLFRLFAKSRWAWIASALVLPNFATKLLDRIYDAWGAGNFLDVALYALPLILVLTVLNLFLRTPQDSTSKIS